MTIKSRISHLYETAKDHIAECLWNGPGMVRIPFSEGAGKYWTNYYGWVPKNIWNCELRRAGLIDLMSRAGMSVGWRRHAWCFPDSVRLLDTALDRNGHRAAAGRHKRAAARRKSRGK